MDKIKLFCGAVSLALLAGCGPSYYLPATGDRPGKLVTSAYTTGGCLDELQQEAKKQGVEVRNKEVQSHLGWQIFLFPLYQGYECTGEVVKPDS